MGIIAFIEDDRIVQKILKHLGLWEIHNHDPPSPNPSQPPEALTYYDFYSQIHYRTRFSNPLK
jgi:hypothetical protein